MQWYCNCMLPLWRQLAVAAVLQVTVVNKMTKYFRLSFENNFKY